MPRFRFSQGFAHDRQRISRALGKERGGHAIGEAQRVQHEFEADLFPRHRVLLEKRRPQRHAVEILLRLFYADLAHHAVGKRELGMRSGADAQIIAEAPVVEIVPALAARLSESRRLVMPVTRIEEHAFDRVIHVCGLVVVGQRRRLAMEQRVGLDREVIERQMRWSKRDHEIEVYIAEDRERGVGSASRFVGIVDASERAEMFRIEALHAEG